MSSNVWGFAYNATHMAGVQVFLQAIMNGNHLVQLFKIPKVDIYNSIDTYRVTNVSATPTYLRLLLPKNTVHPTVSRVTSGGEKFDSELSSALKLVFPNALFRNIYASTEAGSLFTSEGNSFKIPTEWRDLVKIENNELVIHKSLLGDEEIANGEWYRTGDIVQFIDTERMLFEFVSRKNEMINIGGYKVNPIEVEEELRAIDGIELARVFSKKSTIIGNILCCEITTSQDYVDETYVRMQLSNKLQDYKIPRLVKITDTIRTGRTGKTSRI
jgi:acyl-coenzyme A synthetase/AMP-(fatty) acid ligase